MLMMLSTVWLGLIGFLDDYIKVFSKNKEGLSGRFKVLGQVGLGITVGWVLFFSNDVTVRQYLLPNGQLSAVDASTVYQDVKLMITTIPFAKNNELNYGNLFAYAGAVLQRSLRLPLHSHRHPHHHGREQRRQHHRRPRRPGGGHFGYYRHHAGHFRFREW